MVPLLQPPPSVRHHDCPLSTARRHRRSGRLWRHRLLAIACAAAAIAGCAGDADETAAPRLDLAQEIPNADPERGRRLIDRYGCGTCHTVPGVDRARGRAGAPLDHWSRRGYIAGALPNTPENLIAWIVNPQAIEPGTAMPALGVTAAEASDMAAYLYTLR